MYRGKLWTIRQYSGFGTAEETNERYKFLLEQGGTGLSVAARPADPDRLRLRRSRRRGGGRPGRRRARHARRRRDPLRRHPARPDLDVVHDQRHGGDHAAPSTSPSARSRACRASKLARHDPERHPQGVRRPRHVDLAAAAVDAPDRRHDRVLRQRRRRASTPISRRRAPTSATPAPTRRRRWRSRWPTASTYCDEVRRRGAG